MAISSDPDPNSTALSAGRGQWGPEWTPTIRTTAPGRIELLGNHVDYNGGPVLAAAIDRYAIAFIDDRTSMERRLEVYFADTDTTARIDPAEIEDWRNDSEDQSSADFARGAVAALLAQHRPVRIGKIALSSSVPMGIGVSSSAALCLALVQALSSERLESKNLILLAQEAEHRAGTPCGTMDQSASVAGGVILFDGATLSFEQLIPQLGDLTFLVVDSGVQRSLSNSKYPVRVDECRVALQWLNRRGYLSVENLAQLSKDDLGQIGLSGLDETELVLMSRVKHIVDETARVREGYEALLSSDWERFGELMTASGRSSATLYDISHPEVEDIVATLLRNPAVVGARMMGGGEGGSLLALVRNGGDARVRSNLEESIDEIRAPAARQRAIYPFGFAKGATFERLNQYPSSS